jgi:polar amino acid transport system substrate-binding protein
MRLAINATFAPFESVTVNEGKEEFEGIDIDIANYLAETMGFEIEITDMTFDGLIGSLTSGRSDMVISGISPTQERLQNVDFSTSYFWPSIAIISRVNEPYDTPESLDGKKVAVPFGTSYETKAQTFPGVEIVSITGTPSVIQELKNARVEAAVIDGCQAAEFVKIHPDLQFTLLPIEKIMEDSFAIAFPKNSPLTPVFNEALQEMMDNGELDKIIVKWLGETYLADYKAGLAQ